MNGTLTPGSHLQKQKKVSRVNQMKQQNLDELYQELEKTSHRRFTTGFYFHADDIKKIATIVKPKTSGAKIDPFSTKNLPKVNYKIPSKDITELYSITENLSKTETLQFYRKVNSDFISSINKLNGKKINLKEEFKKSRLNSREFIHSIGLWDKYIEYVKQQLQTI